MGQQKAEKTVVPIKLDKALIFEKYRKLEADAQAAALEQKNKIKEKFKQDLAELSPKIIEAINNCIEADKGRMQTNGVRGRSLEYETDLRFLNNYPITRYAMLALLKGVYIEFKKSGWDLFGYTLTMRGVDKDKAHGGKEKALFYFGIKITIYEKHKPEDGIFIDDYSSHHNQTKMDKFYRLTDIRDLENLLYHDFVDCW